MTTELEISDRLRDRFDRIREQCKDDFTPAPSDEVMFKSLLDEWESGTDDPATATVLYLTTLRCTECGNRTTYSHEGPRIPMDQSAPWPDDVQLCPECGTYYPDDLGAVTEEVAEAETVAHPERRESPSLWAWSGDVNDAAVDEWIEETTTYERVRDVAIATTDPQASEEIADRAHVGQKAAEAALASLVHDDRVEEVSTDDGPKYKRADTLGEQNA